MKYIVLIIICSLPITNTVFASDNRAREIMQLVDARDEGDNVVANVEMLLIDKNKKQRKRTIQRYIKYVGDDRHCVAFFVYPADVKDTGFLSYDYSDVKRDDDQWLYLPALQKTKRIASSDQSGSYMGTDLNYSDTTSLNLPDYEFKLLKETKVKGKQVWVIEALPLSDDIIDKTGYSKSVLFIRQDNYVVLRSIQWVEKSNKLKYMDTKKLEKIDGIWVALEMSMTTKKGKKTLHKTKITITDIKFNQKLDKNLFTVRRLATGL